MVIRKWDFENSINQEQPRLSYAAITTHPAVSVIFNLIFTSLGDVKSLLLHLLFFLGSDDLLSSDEFGFCDIHVLLAWIYIKTQSYG